MSTTGPTQAARQQLQAFLNAGLISEAEYRQASAELDARTAPGRGQDTSGPDTKKPRHM